MTQPIDRLFFLIDFLGVFVGAVGGALGAVRDTRYKYDLVGVTGLALASALGGGITRDLILQKGPPLAFVDARYLITAFAGAVVGLIFASRIGEASRISKNTERAIVVVDAVALGLFAVAGSTRALNAGLSRLPALLIGGITAVGGGSIRDVLSGRTPKIKSLRETTITKARAIMNDEQKTKLDSMLQQQQQMHAPAPSGQQGQSQGQSTTPPPSSNNPPKQ